MDTAHSPEKLTPKQARFVAEYLKDLNATQASIRCGYSPRTAKQQGSRLLTNVDVAAAVASAQAQLSKDAEIETARIVEHQGWMATFDPADLYDEQDQIRPIRQLPKHVRCCLASIDVLKVNLVSGDGSRQTVLRYRFHDKNKAADLEYKRRGLLKERVEVTQRLTLEDLLTKSYEEKK